MKLRSRLLALSVSTVAVIVTVLFAMHLESLTKNWLENAVERNDEAGKLIRREIVLHISDSSSNEPARNLAQTKRNWNKIVAADQELADMLVEHERRCASSSIVEINIIGEDGRVIAVVDPLARQGQDAPHREKPALGSGFRLCRPV